MAADSPWPVIHAERQALIDDLKDLDAASWASPSLCSHWSVRDVFGHITATARLNPPRFVANLAKAGFRFQRMSATDIARETAGSTADQLAALTQLVGASTAPPGPVDAMLGEIIVHTQDIRRPLGIPHDYPIAAVTRVADFFAGSNLLIGGKSRVAGVTLKATDTDWSRGSGPQVSGPALSLVLAITGRTAALADLSGPGVDLLRARG
jgi:uncharacterized protein (TIGR03083 family)